VTPLRILITGSAGLIGSALRQTLAAAGHQVVGLDLRGTGAERGDVRDCARVMEATKDCDGIVHLAAISRVVWAERDPHLCWDTNVRGLAHVITAAQLCARPPWLVFTSSREVYGDAKRLPVTEGAPLRPLNVYARSKVQGEMLVKQAAERGLRTASLRLSNVYGRTSDHADRVVPAFARAAACGDVMRVEGADHVFDFTHVVDVVHGLLRTIERLASDRARSLPPIQLVGGRGLSLGQLAALANHLGGGRSLIVNAPPRHFDASRFYGRWDQAHRLLGWMPGVNVPAGLAQLIADFRAEASTVLTKANSGTPPGLTPADQGQAEIPVRS